GIIFLSAASFLSNEYCFIVISRPLHNLID
ncbi:MAG: hypothetical protein ACI9VT_003807, partial [Psychroserpens sp.]